MEEQKLKDEAPLLFGLKKRNIYQVPEGFSGQLEKDIRRKYPRSPRLRKRIGRWIKYSVATVVVLLSLLSSVKFIVEKKYVPVETERSFYNITDGDADREQLALPGALNQSGQ